MKRIYILLSLLITLTVGLAQNNLTMNENDYKSSWLRVAEFENKSLPQSAAKVVDSILLKAINAKNSPQVIKALIHQGKYEMVIDSQNDSTIFINLNEMLKESSDVVEKSVIHSMLGELYLQYYNRDQWVINQRTELGGYVPGDMKEWTRTTFYNKVVEHLNASIAAKNELLGIKVESYSAVVDLGKDSRKYFPTMYDFLSTRAIELFKQLNADTDLSKTLVSETYNKLLNSLLDREMKEAVLLTELDNIDYLSTMSNVQSKHSKSSLEEMLKKWESEPISVEIIDRLANLYQQEIYRISQEDSLLKVQKTKDLYEFLERSIKKFPDYERISVLENRLLQITKPLLRVTGNKTFPLNEEKTLKLTFKNLTSLTAKLYRIDSPIDVQMYLSGMNYNINRRRTFVKDIPIKLPETAEYLENNITFELSVNEYGTYMLEFDSEPDFEDQGRYSSYFFSVSDLAVFQRSSEKNIYELFVVDRVTGSPVSGAEVSVYKLPGNWRNSKLTHVETITTNRDGLAVYTKYIPNNDVFYVAALGKDNASMLNRLPFAYFGSTDSDMQEQVRANIFTDRGLYRPGQTVYFKAILSRSKDGGHSVITDKKVEFVLLDANQRELSKQMFTTNEFGSVSGEFVLPQGVLPGMFTISSENGRVGFRVEEYKRPTFEVTFDKIEGTYKFGEEVSLTGRAESFSGIKLQDAVVDWTITRQQMWWRMWTGAPEHFANGTLHTDKNGEFNITFTPEKSEAMRGRLGAYSFVVEATITDVNGETQMASYTVSVGDVSMVLQVEMPAIYEKNSDEGIVISAKNLDGVDIEAKGTYQIYSVQENDSINKLVAKGDFVIGEQKGIKKELSRMKSDKYRLKLVSNDDRGNTVEAEYDFVLFSYNDKRPPIKTNEWFIVKNTTFSTDKAAEVLLGVSDNVHVLYELWQEQKLLERKWIELNNENRLFSFPYSDEYKNGVTLMLTYVKDEKFYSHKADLRPEKEQKELKVRLDVFRDRITPGSDEEWRISVTDNSGNPLAAEVLASMYDFSLDNISYTQPWNLNLNRFDLYKSMRYLVSDRSFDNENANAYFRLSMNPIVPFSFDSFKWFGFSLQHGRMMLRGGGAANDFFIRGVAPPSAVAAQESAVLDEVAVVAFGTSKRSDALAEEVFTASEIFVEDSQSSVQSDSPQIRRNFNETAFFYPQLRTNDRGETQVAFTVPESNTRWKFRVLAHDKNLNSATAEAFTVSQKELMVTPNMPRFLRHGDITTISTKISNLSDSVQQGRVRMEFFNPATDEVINNINFDNRVQEFTLEPTASSDAKWMFEVPSDIDIVGVRIVAESEQFSDGEQHALAVLPNRMLVTESMRMDLNGNESKTYRMNSLLNSSSVTKEDYRLTLEFASNPAWYAVQALPVLGNPTIENSVSWFASYYANSLGAYIAKAYPNVSAMIDSWKKQGGNEETLLSNLEKNEELKSLLLEEIPWVMEAKNETEQKEKLSLLFDLNRSSYLTQTALLRLQELQTTEGGWSWFKGFKPSVSISHYILYGFSQLKNLKAITSSEDVVSMQSKAISFIDAEAIRRFESLKKFNKDWKNIKSLSTTDLEYLFVRTSYDSFNMDSEVKEMKRFYSTVVERNWTQFGLYERSLIALIMQKQGKTNVVQNILKSYREHSVVSEEMGMHWPNNRAGVFMSQSAVSVHTFMMNAFLAGGASDEEIDNMKRWLLKQKQTQLWESTHATADAVFALLSTGSDWFSSEGDTEIKLGDTVVDADSKELGTGYIKESWSRKEITPDMGNVSVAHRGNSPAWGALYLQYFEDIDKVEKLDGSLDIEKLMFVEETTSEGVRLKEISDDNQISVGDKVVVRLTVRVDRDMEFVHIKDMRASAFEPINQLSRIGRQNGVVYYETSLDASTNFFFDNLPKGTYLFEYSVYASREGSYSSGMATIESMYATEFKSHTAGERIVIKD